MTRSIRLWLLILVLVGMWTPVSAQTCDETAVMRTTQPMARPDYQVVRQGRITQQLASGSFDAIALGDSIMSGWPGGYLQSVFGGPTLNASFGGDGTQHLLWRLHTLDWSRQHPRYVFLLIGTNDIRNPACAVVQGVVAVVHEVHRLFPAANVIVTAVLPRGTDMRDFDSNIIETNQRLAALARTERFRFLDVHDEFLCNHHTPCSLYLSGNLHLTRDGYDVLVGSLHGLLQAGG